MNNTTRFDGGPDGEHIVLLIISFFGVLFNASTIIIMLTNFTRIFGNFEACFVTNLALADLLTSLSTILWALHPVIRYSNAAGYAILSIVWMSVSASFLTLLCMSFERFVVVSCPLKAQRYFKKPNGFMCCGVVWFVSILSGSMITVNQAGTQFYMTILFELCLTASIGFYAAIYRMMKKLQRDSYRTAARYTANNTRLNLEVEGNEFALHHRVIVRQESRVTNMVLVLVIILTLTVLPHMIVLQINLVYDLFCSNCRGHAKFYHALSYSFPLEMVNFVLNPVVYAWWLPKFRQASKKTFRRLLCCKSRRHNANMEAQEDYSYSSDSDSLGDGPATIFTGQSTAGTPLNNNSHPWGGQRLLPLVVF